ncbi:MAG: LytTR family DNA-binding domain-containing protein [Daejeonella sp.]
MDAIIIDKDEELRKTLFFRIEGHCPDVHVKKIISSLDEAKNYLNQISTQLAFLNIFLFRENDFELFPYLKKRCENIIFTSIDDTYFIKAMKASAVNYILKPILIEDLQNCTTLCADQNQEDYLNSITALRENLNDEMEIQKLTINVGAENKVLNLDDILFVQNSGTNTTFQTIKSGRLKSENSFKYYEDFFSSSHFLKTDSSIIVNLKNVNLNTDSNSNQLTFIDGSALPFNENVIKAVISEITK